MFEFFEARCRTSLPTHILSGFCVLQLRGVRPFLSDKYDLTRHPNYKYTADYDKKLTFDIERYLSTRAKLHPKDAFFVVEEESEGGKLQ